MGCFKRDELLSALKRLLAGRFNVYEPCSEAVRAGTHILRVVVGSTLNAKGSGGVLYFLSQPGYDGSTPRE